MNDDLEMSENYDVIIVGAGTAGTYMGWLLGKLGHSVLVMDKDERDKVGSRLDIIHFETDRIEKAGIPPFKVGNPDCIEIRDRSRVVTPDFEKTITTQAFQTIVRLSYFLQRMYKVLETDGVILKFSCRFLDLLFENEKIIGVRVEEKGQEREIKARLVIDASGTSGVIRTNLPPNYGVETFKLGPQDVMYVLLQYIKWKKPEEPHPISDTSYIYYLLWFGPSHTEDTAILGVGQPGSYENAKLAREAFLDRAEIPPYEIYKEEQGFTPYRRPPYSLVGNGFLCIGDAGVITYPFSGHGVTATWMLCLIAAEVIDNALKTDGYVSREKLWEINVRYFRDQGAKFAALLTLLSGILNFGEKGWNYFLKKGLIYKTGDDDEIPEPNKEYEEEMSIGELLKFLGSIIGGMIKGKLSFKNFKRFLTANGLSGKIKKHYEKFPEDISEFEGWVLKANELWKKKKVAIKKLPNVEIEYH
jgi:digeranylgeranylglycerophospholipid reductase